MDSQEAQKILNTILNQVFGRQVNMPLETFISKYAFDIKLPNETYSTVSNERTWMSSLNPNKIITSDEAYERTKATDWEQPKREIKSIEDVLVVWSEVNYTVAERLLETQNVFGSDMVIASENVYRSQDVVLSKNVIVSDGAFESEFVAASHRSKLNTYCARIEDSKQCSNSFNVSWAGKVSNSLFIHNSIDMFECIFCSHMRGRRYCIANMQFTEAEYMRIKPMVIDWILNS